MQSLYPQFESGCRLFAGTILSTATGCAFSARVPSHYRILVSRANLRPEAELYPFNVRESIPEFLLPLQPPDQEPIVNLSEVLGQVYQEAALDLEIESSLNPYRIKFLSMRKS
ncbi:MAG TPA: hypothetical protein DDZ80_11330 [Cyanobacteria bacterium UBA8803]|nr:hypothetical protein [Cyanobacteria bacterium UBA9273]HBL59083.1 hypothetical protein [Cyanobacteria bacterium UBA8803]